jgi:hypothetical protein
MDICWAFGGCICGYLDREAFITYYYAVTPFLTLLISSVSHILSICIPRVCVLFLFFFALVVRNTLKNKGYGM